MSKQSTTEKPLIIDGKLFGRIPMSVMQALDSIYVFGAAKHPGKESWKQQTSFRYWNDKIRRHSEQIQQFHYVDAESHELHALHIAMDALCLAWHQMQQVEEPDGE